VCAPERPKVIGRILSLGFPMPGPRVDNYTFASAPSFFDYDALVVNPAALRELIDGIVAGAANARTFSGAAVRNVPQEAGDVALADVLSRRREETARLFDNGGVVVVFAHPPVTHNGIVGMASLQEDFWLGEIAPPLLPAEGAQARVVDATHPMAPFLLGQLANVTYRARLDEAAVPAAAQVASDAPARVFARSYGGAAIGMEIPLQRGRLVLLPAIKPPPSGEPRYATSDALQSCIRRMLGVTAEGREPYWLNTFAIPGLDERSAALEAARAAHAESERALREAEASHDDLARYRRLLWQEGAVGLDEVVLQALRLIGFTVYASNPEELALRTGETSVLLEIEGSDGPVGLAPHYRLRQRVERAIERRGAAPRGLIVINGHRLEPPEKRTAQASAELRVAAETMRYAIATTTGLFAAVVAALSGEESTLTAYREKLATTDGLVE
jgi:hypothetical protein